MHPIKERMKLLPKLSSQLLKIAKLLQKLEKASEKTEGTLISLIEVEKAKYDIMNDRFKELNELLKAER